MTKPVRFFAVAAILAALWTPEVMAGAVEIPVTRDVTRASMRVDDTDSDALDLVIEGGLGGLQIAKIIFSGLAVIYLVYLGIMIVVAMGADTDIATYRRQGIYTVLAFLFVNIPGQMYALFGGKEPARIGTSNNANFTSEATDSTSNLFISYRNWGYTITENIVPFLQIGLVGVAIFLFTLSGIKMITSRGNDEFKAAAKGNIFYGVMALIFVGVIEAWTRVVYRGDIEGGQGIFAQLTNLALFIAGPTVVFFLIRGAYYLIISAGDEEKAKKGKEILINTFIATILLLAVYTFLNDLRALVF
ncbi:MAG TPA: hypothetical protein PK765_02625 [bacterium]|nr:hypothetical protein [bacterium]